MNKVNKRRRRRIRRRKHSYNYNVKRIVALLFAIVLVIASICFCIYFIGSRKVEGTKVVESKAEETQISQPQVQTPVVQPPTIDNTQTQKETTVNPAYANLTKEQRFYTDAVFIGDSVMLGFEYYNAAYEDELPGARFLAGQSYSAFNALNREADDEMHPAYEGQSDYIWNNLKKMNAKKAIVFLGINDFNIGGLDLAYDNILEVIDKIQKTNPGIEVYFLSVAPILYGEDVGKLTNANIASLNEKMKAYCNNSSCEYIDLYSSLVDEKGGLKDEYCSDGFLHERTIAYDKWVEVLLEYAKGRTN